MGNILRCLTGGDNHGDDHYRPHYHPTSEPGIVLQGAWGSPPPRFPPDHHQLGPHGGGASLVQDLLNFESTSMVTYALLPSPFRPLFPCVCLFNFIFAIYSVTVSSSQPFFFG